jgi:simple sugar transport system substrate-binding protein
MGKSKDEIREEKAKAIINSLASTPITRRRALSTMAKAGIAAGIVAAFGAGFGGGYLASPPKKTGFSPPPSGFQYGEEPAHPQWNFVFVNHVTTNPFFTPTQYGIQDAALLLGIKYQWTGSETSDVPTMVNDMEQAIANKADGIAVSVIDPTAFQKPIQDALNAGIPVVAYNSNVSTDDPKFSQYQNPPYLAYVGQSLYFSGQMLGQKIRQLVPKGSRVGLFIATPGTLNIQPRIDGIQNVLGSDYTVDVVATGPLVSQEQSAIESYYNSHPDVKGLFAVDAGSTQGVGNVLREHGVKTVTNGGSIAAGGYDLLPQTLQNIKDGYLDVTIDQQPYLQGFLPALYLYLYKLSGTLVYPPETDTGLKFVTKDNVQPYLSPSRFEGSTSSYPTLVSTT